MKKIKLGILDQSVVTAGRSASEAIQETIATAKLAEALGYSRFWVSEHHNSPFIAGSAPEVLMVKLADETSHIRIGSGGIMLPNHSALKVAENFRTLESLFPGRIDLGMGRAPGSDQITASILNPSNNFSEESYIKQLDYLQRFFSDSAATLYGRLLASPQVNTTPAQWILSSSGGSAGIAAKFGMGLVIARFINGLVQPDVADLYRKNFESSAQLKAPALMLAVFVLCAETEEKSKELRKFMEYIFLQFEKGIFHGFGDVQTINDYQFSETELERLQKHKNRLISGTPDQVKNQLTQLAFDFDVNEIIISSMTIHPEDRKKSFELVAEAFDLKN
jgi:luciferase family oxidoreductase group 1